MTRWPKGFPSKSRQHRHLQLYLVRRNLPSLMTQLLLRRQYQLKPTGWRQWPRKVTLSSTLFELKPILHPTWRRSDGTEMIYLNVSCLEEILRLMTSKPASNGEKPRETRGILKNKTRANKAEPAMIPEPQKSQHHAYISRNTVQKILDQQRVVIVNRQNLHSFYHRNSRNLYTYWSCQMNCLEMMEAIDCQ